MSRNDALLLAALLGAKPQSRLSANDRQAIADQRELNKVMAELRTKLQHDLPGLSEKALERMSEMTFGLVVILGEDAVSEAMANDASSKILEVLVTAKVEWAIEVTKNIVKNKIRPAYDNALKAKVDPVAVLMANFQLTREKAEAAVNEFRKEDGADLTKVD